MISLQPITWADYRNVLNLKVVESQKGFVAPNSVSLAEAYLDMVDADGDPFVTLAICNADEAVGFIMSARDDDCEYENDNETCCFINRFMIYEKLQGRGFGKAAMEQLMQYLKSTWPRGEAAHLYLGCKETGQVKYGNEIIARLKL